MSVVGDSVDEATPEDSLMQIVTWHTKRVGSFVEEQQRRQQSAIVTGLKPVSIPVPSANERDSHEYVQVMVPQPLRYRKGFEFLTH